MIYAGKESEVLEPVNVSEIVEGMLELLKISISKHARLETDLFHQIPAIQATVAQISQLVMNLIMNASESMGDSDGVIRVTTRYVMTPHGSQVSERLTGGEYVQLEISDTGRGMSPEIQARVFDPFFSTKSPGRGLGLALVDGIVRRLGGVINLASEPGHGTTFQIWLPCAGTNSAAIGGPVRDIGQPARRSQATTVLLVEDEASLRSAVSKMLGKRGFSVIEAPDGTAALDAIRGEKNSINVLLLDITLPGASSREVLQEARRLRPDMRVVVTSAYAEEVAAAYLESTMEHFIRKPYMFEDLVRLI
jgi:CheY-like chemotaxis protein/two-component sensor histidine kinase